eukprot:3310653-Amphidinium_carterae.1
MLAPARLVSLASGVWLPAPRRSVHAAQGRATCSAPRLAFGVAFASTVGGMGLNETQLCTIGSRYKDATKSHPGGESLTGFLCFTLTLRTRQ